MVGLLGCATAPTNGAIVNARVSIVVSEKLFKQYENLKYSTHLAQAIKDGINEGVSIEDVREGRFILCNCRYGSKSGSWFKVKLPKNIHLNIGDYIELEAGIESWKGHPGTLSTYRRVLPTGGEGRPVCFPKGDT